MLTRSIKVLSSGIDSLYVSFRGQLRPDIGESLARLKAMARESAQGQAFALSGAGKAVVQPSGWGRYRYWLRCDGFDIYLSSTPTLPVAYVRLRSSLIHEVGPVNAVVEAGLVIDGPFVEDAEEARCSRVDIYSDFQGWVPRSGDYERFVVRSRKNTWHTAVHHDGRNFTGFTFGRDAIVARLYDKSLEIKRSGKDWMLEVWGDRLDVSQPVWRLEFQFRRQVLRECGLNDPAAVIEHRDHLWRYSMQWLSLRQPQRIARRVRWPAADVWTQLARSTVDSPANPLVRKRIKKHDESVLVRGLAGYATSLAAITGLTDLDVAMALSRRRIAEHMDATGRKFSDVVVRKRQQRPAT